jgi:hypothetical protein
MDALAPMYHLHRVAAFPAFDDPERNLLILYRLDAAIPSQPPQRRSKPVIPHMLRVLDQQLSPSSNGHMD